MKNRLTSFFQSPVSSIKKVGFNPDTTGKKNGAFFGTVTGSLGLLRSWNKIEW